MNSEREYTIDKSTSKSAFSVKTVPKARQVNELSKPRVIRGPYLQLGTESSVIICWGTETPVRGRVWYGSALDQLSEVVAPTITDNHKIKLTKLKPDQKYYYAIGTLEGVQQGGSEDYFFITAPAKELESEEVRPLRIWVVGDSGRGNDIAARVRDGYSKFNEMCHTDLWLMLGDNAYDIGIYAEYQQAVFEMYPELLCRSVLWTAIGNHDAGSANSMLQVGPYYELFTLPTFGEAGGIASETAAYYSFDYGNIHFICLDSYGSDRCPNSAMFTWLAQDITKTDKHWKIAFWHHPPYTKGSHDSDIESELIEIRERALPILEDAGVDIVLSGHSHSYERSYLIDGHYGYSESFVLGMKKDRGSGRESESGAYQKSYQTAHEGTVYIVAGTSGLADEVSKHPAMHTSLSIPGSLVIDVCGSRLDVNFIDEFGEVKDYFSFKKTIS